MLDPQRIRQIAFNLVGNAVKFTKQGFVELSASFEPTCAEAGTFTLSVQDTGCGISAEDQKRLASPFVQVGAQKAKAGGTGLGLSICRKLAKAMGGDLRIASELGKGTTFSIVVPGVKVVGEELRTESGKCKVKEESSATLHSLRILFADDTKLNHIVMKNMLKKVGVEDVVSAANGREALEILRREGPSRFDLVLTDMFMPEMTGEDLVKEIRADANLSSMPVYVFTADVEIQKCYAEMGFTNFLLKPVSVEKLHTLTSHLNG
jgi:CheY-like chemotaxis protein